MTSTIGRGTGARSLFEAFGLALLLAGTTMAVACTDNSGNGHYMPREAGAAGTGGGGTGGSGDTDGGADGGGTNDANMDGLDLDGLDIDALIDH